VKNKFIGAVAILFFLVGCGDSDVKKLESAVKDRLIDPGSVKFGSVIFSKDGEEACIEYNAKKRMGGYVGQNIAMLELVFSEWRVKKMNAFSSDCPKGGRVVHRDSV
jgi:hypothetical protein